MAPHLFLPKCIITYPESTQSQNMSLRARRVFAGCGYLREVLSRLPSMTNREIPQYGMPTLLSEAEGNMTANDKASSPSIPRGRRPSARIETSGAGTGRPHASPKGDDLSERPSKATRPTEGKRRHGESDES